MDDEAPSILEKTLARLTHEFGPPLRRGDCCWWTLSRDGRKPVRISLFIDGHDDIAMGWMCDLHDPIASIQHFSISTDDRIDDLTAQISTLLTTGARPVETPEPGAHGIIRRAGTG